jgi:hypothetical protein
MHASRFDIVVAGDSLAGRIAAALLVKHGKRLLILSTLLCRDPWLHSSLFVEKLLGILGGRACFAPYEPFQVLSCRSRVTIHPELSLGDELAREFGDAATAVMALLAELESTGKLLEELLWEFGGLPTGGWREAASWHWLCLRRKLSLPALTLPLTERCRNLPEAAAEWLRDLFQGLSLKPLETLTVADGALLWAYACRPESLAAKELDQLLHKRFEQFHGVEAGLETLSALEHRHGQWHGTLQGGSQFQAQHLILGDLSHEIDSHGLPLPPQLPAPNRQFLTSALDGRLSPLLEQRVIAGGTLPVRMVVTATTAGLAGQIGSCSTADDVQVLRQLEPVLPFVRYTLDRHPHDRHHADPTDAPGKCLPLFRLPLRLGNQLWCADETRLLPHLGIGGAALLAWTLVRILDPSILIRSS